MPNHAARTYVLGMRAAMQALQYPDESPKNIIHLREKLKVTRPSPSAIQLMFGNRLALAQRAISSALLDIINKGNIEAGISVLDASERIISFDSYIEGLGILINRFESSNNSATSIKEQIAISADLEETVVDSASRKRLLPYRVCSDICNAIGALGEKRLRVRTLADADNSCEVPARDDRGIVIQRLESLL
jgi:hypothetical protein